MAKIVKSRKDTFSPSCCDKDEERISGESTQHNTTPVCEYSKQRLTSDDTQHDTCDNVSCPNGCKKTMLCRKELENHTSECPRQEVVCPFMAAGCKHKCLRKHMSKHINDNPLMHLAMACDTVVFNTHELKRHTDLITTQKLQIKELLRKVNKVETLCGSQCIWKIQGFKDKQNAAKTGTQTTIFSPSFLTSRHGYKLMLSLCPYGDGKSTGKFLSVFICICKGEHDAILQWPFHLRVTFTLIDQHPDPRHRKNATFIIKPKATNENKTFLGRPIGPRNPSFGTQQLIELNLLDTRDYIRDDVMFIKCTVDC